MKISQMLIIRSQDPTGELLRHLVPPVPLLEHGGVLEQVGDGLQGEAGVHVLLHPGHAGHRAQELSSRVAQLLRHVVRRVDH